MVYTDYDEEFGEGGEPPPPYPPPEELQLLFLIEFLVDTLRLHRENLDTSSMDPCKIEGQGQCCVVLSFLHFPQMCICEKDFCLESGTRDNEVAFHAGKSLMFGLTEGQFEKPPRIYLGVSATRKLPHGSQPSELPLGATRISLNELFQLVFDKFDEHRDVMPQSRSMKEAYELKEAGSENVIAEVDVYVRLTCLGQNVVTEFQRGEPFLFKNQASFKVFECQPKAEEDESTPFPGWTVSRPKDKCKPKPPPDPADEDYEDVVASINGHALRVKLVKSKRREPPPQFDISEFCACDVPLPRDIVGGQPELTASQEDACKCAELYEAGGPGEFDTGVPEGGVGVGSCNKIVIEVPPDNKLVKPDTLPLRYNVQSCFDDEHHGHKTPDSYRIVNDLGGDQCNLPNDPEADVYVFKLMKRGRYLKGKSSLDLEFRTPKPVIRYPYKPPLMLDREAGPDKKKKKDKKR